MFHKFEPPAGGVDHKIVPNISSEAYGSEFAKKKNLQYRLAHVAQRTGWV